MFASGLALLALAGLCRYFSARNRWMIFSVGVAAAVITVTHPFTAMWFSIAAIAIVAGQSRFVLRETALGLLAAGALAVVLALLWPYYSVLALVPEASNSSLVHAALYRGVSLRAFLLIPGAAALMMRARQSARDPLLWMFIGGVTVYAVGYLTGSYGLGRVTPLIALSAHVALAHLVAGWLTTGDRQRTAAAWVGVAVIGVVGLLGSGGGLIRMVPRAVLPASLANDDRLNPMVEPYVSLEEVLASTDVAFASRRMRRVVPAVQGRVVVPGDLTPLLSDRTSRDQDRLAFFSDDSSTADRDAIASRWGVTHVVVEPADLAEYPLLQHSYRVIAETDAYVVFSLE